MSSQRFTVKEVISQVLEYDTDTDEDVSELEDASQTDENADEDTENEWSMDHSEGETATSSTSSERNDESQQPSSFERWMSKDGKIEWTSTPPQQRGRPPASIVIKNIPGPTRFAISRVHDIHSAFE